MIKMLHTGILSSIQDNGRVGLSKYGIPISGAMDSYSYQIGNILLKNSKNAASIEITLGGAKFLFEKDAYICITGANFSPAIDNVEVEMFTVLEIQKGSILSFGKHIYGARTYVAIQGGVTSETVLKSKSFFQGITPKFSLQKEDTLSIPSKKVIRNKGFSKIKRLDALFDDVKLECYPGPEYHLLNESQKEELLKTYTISKDNNRVGYRLEERMKNDLSSIITSAVMPGTIQLTPSGTLIVLMRDAQPTGGYPRILQLSEFAISKLSQKMTGKKIQFQLITNE